jgi:hypothetical protein
MRDTERELPPDMPALSVRLPDGQVLRFSQPFHIGRDLECEVQIQDVHVSRRHAVVSLVRGQWSIRDLQSSNGLIVDGEHVETAAIGDGINVTLGTDGPSLQIDPEAPPSHAPLEKEPQSTEDSMLLEGYAERYFGSGTEGEVGGRTMMIRKAFQKIQQNQRRKHRWVIAAVVLAAVGASGYAYHAHRRMSRLEADAQKVFYDMKSFDVAIAGIQQELERVGSTQAQQQMKTYIARRREMESNYEQYVTQLYDRRLNEKERLILRVTRLFGECDLAAPPEYIQEVTRYIGMWQRTGRFAEAVKLAQRLGYPKRIAAEFRAHDLPPQYFYLAMQESDFQAYSAGKRTRWGIAKGMWQFIPDTGQRFGLKIGSLKESPQVDPGDDRYNVEKATNAAARYIKDIYATDAQASGLLVIASYNWGERRIIDLLKKMPENPKDRNFWMLLAKYRDRVPLETYNYVFSIVSAAVIGEHPKLFGFPFDNPLKFAEQP